MQVLCVLLLVALLALMLTVELRRGEGAPARESASTAEYTYVDRLAGYVFRAESTVTDGGKSGALHYLTADGATVEKNQVVLEAYEIGREQDERQRAADLYEEIAYLEQALAGGEQWQQVYLESYLEMMQAVGAGDWKQESNAADRLLPALQQGGIATGGDADALRARIDALYAEVNELIRHAGAPKPVSATIDGRFSYSVDGYEAIFGLSEVKDGALTPERLEYLLGKTNIPDRTVGKVVDDSGFYLAVPVTAAQAAAYVSGEAYEIRMTRGGVTEAVLDYISQGADGSSALLVFWIERMPDGMDLSRRQSVEIKRTTVSGIGLPDSALCFDGENSFVYVIENGKAARRRVEIICREGGCCIAAAKSEEGYLRVGERVLIASERNGVYEGMVLSK